MKIRFKKTFAIVAVILVVLLAARTMLAPKLDIPADVQAAMNALPDDIDYNIHVKKILSNKCFSCHGPDAAKQKGDLRLDDPKVSYHKKAESGLVAINPGSMSKSDMAHRILSDDKEYLMPTPSSHLSLSTEEKAVLLKWIDQGAQYKPHWAFSPIEKPDLPKLKDDKWVKTDIDRFVLDRLNKEGLQPSPEADKETLIRRVSFDVTGLPPTIAEIDAFVKDNNTNAYERMVDKYLQSPKYGERMAAYWLDVARFADSHGYLDDKHRDASPWRDWVIDAYNRNLPFDTFMTWQLAGDLLPNPTREQILATGFNRNQKQNSEAGIIPEEFRVEYNIDRTNTFGTAVMGLTMGCAKCHDHKYDPISQKDYYSLFAFFNSTNELGSANYGAENNIVPGPTLLLPTKEQETKMAEVRNWIQRHGKLQMANTAAQPLETLQEKVIAGLSFDKVEPIKTSTGKKVETVQAMRNSVDANMSAQARLVLQDKGVAGNCLKLDEETVVNFPPYQFGAFERYDPFSFSLWVKLPKVYEESAILHNSDSRRYGFQGYDLMVKENRLNFRLMHAFPHDAISVISDIKLDTGQWYHIAVSYDGSSSVKGIAMYVNGKPVKQLVEYDHLEKNIKPFANIHKVVWFTGLTFGARALERTMKGGVIDEFYLFNNTMNSAEANYLFSHASVPFLSKKTNATNLATDSLHEYRKQLADLYDSTKEVMVMGDLPKPRITRLLLRGVYDSYGDTVHPSMPSSVLPFPKKLQGNRLGLAQWLFLPQNPLTARVAINRVWEMYFGRGLVKTSDDFGNQGEMPSHPALLDYLATQYRDSGWNTKQMQKLILMSATYRQSSVITPELHQKDPQNILLARSSRYKMPAEMLRDNALAISNLLSPKIGGPSVYPYQPAGLWEALSDKSWRYVYTQSQGEDLFRRSIYTIVKRSSPPPFMLIFDAPDRNFCTVKRAVSSSPLQALVLMNDPTFVEASKFVAARMLQEGGTGAPSQLKLGFRLVTGRTPDAKEQALLLQMYKTEYEQFTLHPDKAQKVLATGHASFSATGQYQQIAAYTNVVMALINTDEFITRK